MAWDKTKWRTETAVRLFIANPHLTDAEIAEHIGLTPGGFAQMKQRPEYTNLLRQYTSQILSETDFELGQDYKSMMERHRSEVPVALQALYGLVQSRDEKVKLRAIEQVLNRDGRFAEVSRIGMATTEQGGFVSPADANIANNLVAALNTVKKDEEEDGNADEAAKPTVN
jgi:hypothetical protein